jgi:tripartite-type tricarboxylate transporter receptor subunit TctC
MHIPYKGGGQAIGDVIGGQVDLNMAAVSVGKSLIETNKVKGLLVTSRKRSPAIPSVPSISELGMKFADVDLRFWWGIFGPKGIPDPVKQKIEKAVQSVMADPDVRARLAKLDIEPEFIPGSELKVKLQNEIRNWSTFIDAHGIKAE